METDGKSITDNLVEEPNGESCLVDDQVLIVYGTEWCGDCHRTRRFLDRNAISYHWIDVDMNPTAAALIRTINRGRRTVPTLVFADGTTLTEPSNVELARKLGLG